MFHLLFTVFVVFTTSKLISAQCNSYSDSEQSCLSQFLPNRECWWLDQGQGSGFECTGIMSACMYYSDYQSCNDNSNGGCEWSGSCQTSMCLEKTDSEMCGGSSDAVGECIRNENNNYCSRNSGGSGGRGGGGTATETCSSYSTSDCTPDKLGGSCFVSSYLPSPQGYHESPRCQKLEDLCMVRLKKLLFLRPPLPLSFPSSKLTNELPNTIDSTFTLSFYSR